MAEITPYIATVDRYTSSTINYSGLMSAGVTGMMIEAGYLFDVTGLRAVRFGNPQIANQIKGVTQAGMQYALYMEARAKTIEESRQEMTELRNIVRKYSPSLGVWLRLGLNRGLAINNSIMDSYYTELVKLGFKDGVGVLATTQQLGQIDWQRFSETWYLWLIKPMGNVAELDDITPEFFII